MGANYIPGTVLSALGLFHIILITALWVKFCFHFYSVEKETGIRGEGFSNVAGGLKVLFTTIYYAASIRINTKFDIFTLN